MCELGNMKESILKKEVQSAVQMQEPQFWEKLLMTFIIKNLIFHVFFKTHKNTDKLTLYTFTCKLFFLIKIILKE